MTQIEPQQSIQVVANGENEQQTQQKEVLIKMQNEPLIVNVNYNIHYPNLVSHHDYIKRDSLNKDSNKIEKEVIQIAEQQNQIDKDDAQRKLPHIKLFDDKKEFIVEKKLSRPTSKRNSFQQLPQVFEAKKQLEDQKQILSKLDNFVDKDQFNSKGKIITIPHFIQNNQILHNFQTPIEEIKESDQPAQQKPIEKTILQKEDEKIIVDQIDYSIKKQHNARKESNEEKDIQVITQQKIEEIGIPSQAIQNLENCLDKLHSENDIYKKIIKADSKNDDQVIIPLDTQLVNLITEPIVEQKVESQQQTEKN